MRFKYSFFLCLLLSTALLWAGNTRSNQPLTKTTKATNSTKHKVSKAKKAHAAVGEENRMPPALARHLEKLARAMPGNGGEGGPASAEEQSFLNRAYPDTDIPLDRIHAARAAFKSVQGRNLPRGKGRTGQWVSVGPSTAQYQNSPYRNVTSYVPNGYVASGRTAVLAISDICVPGHCRMWAGPAGGGVWRTEDALVGQPNWKYLSNPFEVSNVSSILVDRNDPTGNTIWVGTGEANASADSGAGAGIYQSTDGGDTWTGPLGKAVFDGRAVGTIAIAPGAPNVIYAGSTRGVRGVTSTSGGAVSLIPGAAMWGLYKSTDGGATWTLVHNGATDVSTCTNISNVANGLTLCSPRGVRRVVIDPSDANTIYAGSYGRGVWRSTDGGATWTQIKASLNSADSSMRPEIAVNKTADGKTRMYVGEGSSGSPYSRLYRADNVATGTPAFSDMTSSSKANAGFGSYDYCTGQCWYDNLVVTPAGYPDMVYLGGSYQYGETWRVSNGRGIVLSTDGGVSFNDMTMDATDIVHPNGLHPDQHFLVTNPNNPLQFFESGDGGIVRSSGRLADISATCNYRGVTGSTLTHCQQLLSAVPTELQSMNKGLTTLQFQSLSVNPHNSNDVQGGTQDNGTWESTGNPVKWLETMWGDGGQSGFDVADPNFRFHTFYAPSPDVNFSGGLIADWNWIADLIYSGESAQFYTPIISDPAVSGTMFVGTEHVWRTKAWGMGTMTLDEFRGHCNEFTGDFTIICGDWQKLGDPTTAGRLTSTSYGGDRSGGSAAAVQRSAGDTSTLWAATSAGRVFVSKNADAEPASATTFTRIDNSTAPGRFVSGIAVDPANPNRAWISYNGFNTSTPTMPGHVFEVTFDPVANTATWTDRSYDMGDLPINSVAFDSVTGDLYASSDYGVLLRASGTNTWVLAAPGMPNVEVPALTIVPGARKLYAATHGLGAWLLNLP